MRRILLTFAAIFVAVVAFGRSIDEIPNVHVADRTQFVSNPDGVLSVAAVDTLNRALAQIWDATSAEIVVVAVDRLDTDDLDAAATELFEQWGIGKKDNDNGLLILISRGQRRAVMRTGYGMEGVLPDIYCSRIIRNLMAPQFKEGYYDAGTIAAIGEVNRILTDPEAAAEVHSALENDRRSDEEDFSELWSWLWKWMLAITAVAAVVYIVALGRGRKIAPRERYMAMSSSSSILLALSFLGLGLPILVWLLMRRSMKRVRNASRKCPNCGAAMQKLDEETDNKYLTPAQDTEEQLNSVDYDVWLCPECGETDVIPFVNNASTYTVCDHCGARACTLTADRVVVQPSTTHHGRGVKEYTCRNCRHRTQKVYDIAKLASAAPIIIGGGGFGKGGDFGGFGGGSFGGGMTGGGGASGGW